MVFEDLHWCDSSTLEAIDSLIERLPACSIMLVMTHRPEYEPPWLGGQHVHAVQLTRLGKRQCAEIVGGVTKGKPLPDDVLNEVVEKTDGVPLFVEELTKTVLEGGFLVDTGNAYEYEPPLPPLAIPATLKDSLMARLNGLSLLKQVAQIGACIGREFNYALLVAVAQVPEDELRNALQELVESELVFRRGAPPDSTYVFKHALVQDIAYESLLSVRRRKSHERIAKAIEALFPKMAESEPSVLARHYQEAGMPEDALPYCWQAGAQARQRLAYPEAASHLSQGLGNLRELPESSGRDEKELEFLLALGPIQIIMTAAASEQVVATYQRTEELCGTVGTKEQRANSFFGMVGARLNKGEVSAVIELVTAYLNNVVKSGDQTELLRAHELHATCEMYSGRASASLEAANRAIGYFDPVEHRDLVFQTGRGSGVMAYNTKAYVAWMTGFPVQGLAAASP